MLVSSLVPFERKALLRIPIDIKCTKNKQMRYRSE